jgi:hypothetical protein
MASVVIPALLLSAKWAAMRANGLTFLDQHGVEAYRLG